MFCFRCGATMPNEAPTCPQCGTAASDAPQIAPRAASGPPVPSYSSAAASQRYSLPPQTEGKAALSMILGILSLTCFFLLAGIPAVILGHISKSNIRKSMGRLGGDGMATAGLIMGYISIALTPLVLAVLIPTMMRSRTEANETRATSEIRKVNTAEVAYSISYPRAGYARDLATLGPGPAGCAADGNQQHACLLDGFLGCSRTWCFKYGYQFHLAATCGQDATCTGYVIVAIPQRSGPLGKSFCSTDDMVVRTKTGVSISMAPTASECLTWEPA